MARAMLYLVAGLTGYRRGEILTLCWSDVILNETNPVILIDKARTKNGKDAVQPIPVGLCTLLGRWKESLNPVQGAALFEGFTEHCRPSEWIKADLTAAELPTIDGEGRKIDFHSLRASYITFLANSKTPVKVTQGLARHSNPTLTMNVYAKILPEIQNAAILSLPAINLQNYFANTLAKNHGKVLTKLDFSGQKATPEMIQQETGKTAFKGSKNGVFGQKRELGRGRIELPTHGFSVQNSTHKPIFFKGLCCVFERKMRITSG